VDGGCPRDVFSTFLPSRRSLFSPSDSCTEDGGNWRVPRYRFTFMIFWGCVLSLCSASFSLLKQSGCRAVNWSVTLSPFRLPNLMHPPASEHTRLWQPMKGKDWLSRALSHPAVPSGATSVLGIWVFPSPQKLQGERDRSQDFQIVALLPVVFLLLGNGEGETGSQMCRGYCLTCRPSLALFCSL
jgi:hypothetical protein